MDSVMRSIAGKDPQASPFKIDFCKTASGSYVAKSEFVVSVDDHPFVKNGNHGAV
jgi:hypothetical protein